jgi:hypothetical protein
MIEKSFLLCRLKINHMKEVQMCFILRTISMALNTSLQKFWKEIQKQKILVNPI